MSNIKITLNCSMVMLQTSSTAKKQCANHSATSETWGWSNTMQCNILLLHYYYYKTDTARSVETLSQLPDIQPIFITLALLPIYCI